LPLACWFRLSVEISTIDEKTDRPPENHDLSYLDIGGRPQGGYPAPNSLTA
jgi:hypothetical protein